MSRGLYLESNTFVDSDLAGLALNHANIVYAASSYYDFSTILKSTGDNPLMHDRFRNFLISDGMNPDVSKKLLEWTTEFGKGPERIQFKSVFISYGGPDEGFARALHRALRRHGVRTFFFPDHGAPGQKLHSMMRSNIGRADKVILICSRSSLNRPGVQNEIEETLAREARKGGAPYLLPIRLDSYVLDGWRPRNAGLAQTIRDRVIANFEGVGTKGRAFGTAVARVVAAL